MFYTFIVTSYIAHAPIGLGLEARLGPLIGIDPNSYILSYLIAGLVAIVYMVFILKQGQSRLDKQKL